MKQSGKTMGDFNFVPTLKKTLKELDYKKCSCG